MPLLGELDRERERLGLPSLGKHRLALVSRQARQRLEALGSNIGSQSKHGLQSFQNLHQPFESVGVEIGADLDPPSAGQRHL